MRNLNVTPFSITNQQSPIELQSAYREATNDKEVIKTALRVVFARHLLLDEAGLRAELQAAMRDSLVSGLSVADQLRECESELLGKVEAAKAENSVYKATCHSYQVDSQPILKLLGIENEYLNLEIGQLQGQIHRFARDRDEAKKKYLDCGLTAEQIDTFGIRPSFEDMADWKIRLAEKMARSEQINKFYQSSPFYDLSLLDAPAA